MLAGGHVGRRGPQPSPEWQVDNNTVQRTPYRPLFEYCLYVQIQVTRLWTSGQILTAFGIRLVKGSVRWKERPDNNSLQ